MKDTVYGVVSDDLDIDTLENLCVSGGIQTGPFGSQLHQKDYLLFGTPIITVEHLGENRILHQDLPRVSDADKERLSRYVMQKGDIIFSRVGSVDRRSLVRDEEDGWLFSGRCLRVRPDSTKIDSDYLSWFFGLEIFKDYIRRIAVGATMPSLNTELLSNVPVIFPPLPEQRAIAQVLGALDDKIELNRHMNRTLEALARAVFRHWFVENEEGEGWKAAQIKDIADVIDCLHSKKPERKEIGKPLLQLSNILDNGLLDPTDLYYITQEDYDSWISRIEASPGDCVITNVGRVGAVAQIPPGFKAALGRNMTAVRCKSDFPFPTFLIECLLSDSMHQEISNKTDTGTILDALNVKNIPLLKFSLPPKHLLDEFERSVRPIRAKMEQNLKESCTLTELRDTLLPKLMSGEVRVKA